MDKNVILGQQEKNVCKLYTYLFSNLNTLNLTNYAHILHNILFLQPTGQVMCVALFIMYVGLICIKFNLLYLFSVVFLDPFPDLF